MEGLIPVRHRGLVILHTQAEYDRYWAGVDREAAELLTAGDESVPRRRCGACERGWHMECWGCGCGCNDPEPDGENPAYGPGNPDWEHDFARELEDG